MNLAIYSKFTTMLLLCLIFSATGGADSRNVSEKGSPTEEQAGAVGNGELLLYFLYDVFIN